MKKLSIIILCIFFVANIYSQDSSDILNIVKDFLEYLKRGNEKDLKKIIYKEIKFENIEKAELIKLGENMLEEKISISEYLIKVTGYNIYKFLNRNQNLIGYKIEGKIGAEVVLEKDIHIKEKLYYLTIKITYKEGDRLIKDKKCEINIVKDNTGKYKILGFIF